MRRLPPIFTTLVVMLLVVGRFAALSHDAAVRHITCAEHGEQVEAAPSTGVLVVADHDRWLAANADGQGPEHDHCAIARAVRDDGTVTASPAPSVAVVSIEHVSQLESVGVFVTTSTYRLAPKTSPPA
jgi:hypothetical protein